MKLKSEQHRNSVLKDTRTNLRLSARRTQPEIM